MTSAVGQYIESYDVNKFLRLTPRQQNKLLYQYFKCKDEKARNSAKCQKSKYLKKIIVTPKVKPSPKRNPPTQSKTPIITPPDDALPHSQSGGLDVAVLPPSVQLLINMGPQLKNIPAWLGPFILEQIKQTTTNQMPGWTRPKLLHPIQNEVIDKILYDPKIKVIMVDGEKRLGKSWMGWIACCEAQFNNRGLKRWFLYGATEKNASMILESVKTEPLIYDYCRPLMDGMGSALKVKFHGTGFMRVMASGSERQTSGTDADVIWIDESHSVLIENPKTIAMSAMVLRAQKNLKIIYTMNREGEAYEYFKNEMLNNFPPDQIAYFSFTKDNCPHIDAVQDQAVRTIVRASAGADYEAQYMDNQYVRQGGLYYPMGKITIAYQPFDPPKLEQYDVIACGIDWGENHDSAFMLMGFIGDEVYELEMIYCAHPSSDELMRVVTRFIREYPGVVFIWETSPLGAFVRKDIREAYPKQRFLNSNFSKRKQSYIDNLYIWLIDEEIHLKNQKLKRQLRSFVNDKKNDDGHDALVHCLFIAAQPRTKMKPRMRVINR